MCETRFLGLVTLWLNLVAYSLITDPFPPRDSFCFPLLCLLCCLSLIAKKHLGNQSYKAEWVKHLKAVRALAASRRL